MIKRCKEIGLALGALLLIFTPALPLLAHDLLPADVRAYLEANPDATPTEIEEYFETGGEVIALAHNTEASFLDNALEFIQLGIGHILSGADHILFVIALLLVFVSWSEILRLTASFTVAHSITLILAGTGALVLSSRFVEPLIAFSISYVAFSTVFLAGRKFVGEHRGKIAMVFFFGLFHGLGFAGLLQDIKVPDDRFISSLISFNIGIELGQIFIVLCVFPFIYFFKDKAWYPAVIRGVALAITILGIFWGIERIFFA